MTVESEANEPNTAGFAGEGTGPEPVHVTEDLADINAEDIAVPAGDLTEGIVEALERDPDESGDAEDES